MVRVAVIGAGIAGLTAANKLSSYVDVVVFDKSRGFGGRCATKRDGEFHFDHGAPYFTVSTNEFKQCLDVMSSDGVVREWNARVSELDGCKQKEVYLSKRLSPFYVGSPGMSAIGRHLAQGLECHLETKVVDIQKEKKYKVIAENREVDGCFDWVVVAVPPSQACEILSRLAPRFDIVQGHTMSRSITLMLGFDSRVQFPFDIVNIKNHDLSSVIVNNSKPHRSNHPALVVHMTPGWARDHFDDANNLMEEQITEYLSQLNLIDPFKIRYTRLHKWRYANPGLFSKEVKRHDFYGCDNMILCGDWCVGCGVESAFLSGLSAAQEVLQQLKKGKNDEQSGNYWSE